MTRGYSVMRGYWDDPAATAAAIDEAGFMHTGDLATIDAEGYCNIVGRLKDVVIRGGENIFPREIEEFLYTHPAIADVQAFGVPDPRYGEELCVWIRRREGAALTEEEVIAFCRASIAHYKAPRYVRFVETLSDDGHRKGAEIPDAARDDGRIGARRGKDSMTFCGEKMPVGADAAKKLQLWALLSSQGTRVLLAFRSGALKCPDTTGPGKAGEFSAALPSWEYDEREL